MKRNIETVGLMSINNSFVGESIEKKVERVTRLNEPILDGAQLVFTERKDGVVDEYNVRTDRWDIAAEHMSEIGDRKVKNRLPKEPAKESEEGIQGT